MRKKITLIIAMCLVMVINIFAEQVTFRDEGSAKCGGTAIANINVKCTFSDDFEVNLGAMTAENGSLSENPPHDGSGDGSVTVVFVYVVTRDTSDPYGYTTQTYIGSKNKKDCSAASHNQE